MTINHQAFAGLTAKENAQEEDEGALWGIHLRWLESSQCTVFCLGTDQFVEIETFPRESDDFVESRNQAGFQGNLAWFPASLPILWLQSPSGAGALKTLAQVDTFRASRPSATQQDFGSPNYSQGYAAFQGPPTWAARALCSSGGLVHSV